MARLPQRSTRNHVGTVLNRYIRALIPAIRMASRPTHPASVDKVRNIYVSLLGSVRTFENKSYRQVSLPRLYDQGMNRKLTSVV